MQYFIICFIAFGWIKINTEPVCFGAKKDTNGHFTIKIPGRIITMKLVHVSGKVNCVRGKAATNWGCKVKTALGVLFTFITLPNKTCIFPNVVHNCDRSLKKFHYTLPGMGPDVPELLFQNLTQPLLVLPGQEFQIWYGEDFVDKYENDNKGRSCTHVYGLYV